MAKNISAHCFWFTISLFFNIYNFSSSVELSQDWKHYIQEIIVKFEKGLIERNIHVIIPQRCPLTKAPKPSKFMLPNLYIWDPLCLYEDIFSQSPLTCSRHKNTNLKPNQWTDGSTDALNPCVMLDIEGPGLLITRNYYCDSGTHDEIMTTIDQLNFV